MKKARNTLATFAVLAVAAFMLTGCNAMKSMCGKSDSACSMKAHPTGCACAQCAAMK